MTKKQSALILAATAAALFATASIADVATTGATLADNQVKCMGANSCKGQGSCKTASNSCKGQNTCKGQGFIMTNTAKDCTDQGGTVSTN